MFKVLDKFGGEVSANEQAIFNKISTNNSSGYVNGYLNSLGISKLTSNAIGIDSGLLSIQGFRFVNDTLQTYTVSVTPSQPIPFQLVAVFSHYVSSENDTLSIITRPIESLRQENLYGGSNAVYELELARFTMTSDGITDFVVTLEQLTYNDQDFTEVLEKVDNAESDSEAALSAANAANSNAKAAVNTANSAAETANAAKTASDTATAKVAELSEQIGEKQGTTVTIGGVAQGRVALESATVGNATNATNIIPDSNGAVNPGGRRSGTVGANSTAFGNSAIASGRGSTALGDGATAGGVGGSTALGSGATASGSSSTALGNIAIAGGQGSTALGYNTTANKTNSTALGSGTTAGGENSTALGNDATASGINSIAIGRDAIAGYSGCVSIGNEVVSGSDSATSDDRAKNAIGIGNSALALDAYSVAIGGNTQSQMGGVAIGGNAQSRPNSVAIGKNTHASVGSTALGFDAEALGSYSTAIGYGATVADIEQKTMQLGGVFTEADGDLQYNTLSVLRCPVNLTVTSDERDKADISDITNALEFLEKLNPVTFVKNEREKYISEADRKSENYRKYGMCDYDRVAHALGTKKGERRRCGLLAQEVVEAMQTVYGTDNYANIVNDNFHDLAEKPSDVENKYTLAYANLVPFLIGAIKELNAEIKILKDKLQ